MPLQSKNTVGKQNYQVLTTLKKNSLQFWCVKHNCKEKFKNGSEKLSINRYINPNLKEIACYKNLSICSESYFSRQKCHSKFSKYFKTRLNFNFQCYTLLSPLIKKTSPFLLSKVLRHHQVGFCALILSLSDLFCPFPHAHSQAPTWHTIVCMHSRRPKVIPCSLFSEVQTQNPTCSFLLQPWGDQFAPAVFPIR